jgi:hypothetical protein
MGLFGKREAESGQWSVWFRNRAEAMAYATDEIRLMMLLGMAPDCSTDKAAAIVNAAARGRYKIVKRINGGDEGFDLVIFY